MLGFRAPLDWNTPSAFTAAGLNLLCGILFPGKTWRVTEPSALVVCVVGSKIGIWTPAEVTQLLKSPVYISGVGTVLETLLAPLRLRKPSYEKKKNDLFLPL